jgi:hypothetical protein
MHPAAARVGPSNEPSVRRIAVRLSSGATICIEKTIKVQFFRASKAVQHKFSVLHRKKRANHDANGIFEETTVKTAR